MKVVFLTNAFAHSQRCMCDALYEKLGDDFCFVSTQSISDDRKAIGSQSERQYCLDFSCDESNSIQRIIDDAEIVIFGNAPLELIKNRIENNKLTIYYSERLFKGCALRFANPITMRNIYRRFIVPGKLSNFYLLCASSYASNDYKRIGAFENRMYKWGYQPEIFEKDIDAVIEEKSNDTVEFVWVGRLIELKHCDHAIKVMRNLVYEGLNVHLTIIGSGVEENNLKRLSKRLSLDNHISFLGNCMISQTRALMDKASIFLFTSDYREGWGMTLNECMNSGVACIASHEAGATNFLITNGFNGLVYKSGDIKQLTDLSRDLVKNREKREKLGKNAYETVYNCWNTKYSVQRLLEMIEDIKNKGFCDRFEDGPCSMAEPIGNKWYKA